MSTQGSPPPPPFDIQYATFSDEINQTTAGKFVHWLDLISLDGRPRHNAVHLLFNSTGGTIVEAINMHNYVKGYPADIPITMFNSGSVQSAAVLVFLGAARRVVCPYARFLLPSRSLASGVCVE